MRTDGRKPDELRPVSMLRHYLKYAGGSVMIEMGNTKLICSASVEERVPLFLRGKGRGWVTAEYSMIPCSTLTRTPRDITRGHLNGRSSEIQRLIGRSLRAVVDMEKLGERTLWIDCDVIQADGGTRTAAITGAYVAMVEALQGLLAQGVISALPLRDCVAAVSVGKVDGELLLDLCFEEDSRAEVDMNVVMTGRGEFIEIQGTAEGQPFSGEELKELLALAAKGTGHLSNIQKELLEAL